MAARGALTLAVLLLAAACRGREPRVAPGAAVKLRYSVKADGRPYHETPGAITVVIGSGDLIAGVEARLMGRRAGERVSFSLPPEDGFGRRDPAKVLSFPRSRFGAQAGSLALGDKVGGLTAEGAAEEGFVTALDSATVTLDFNPPLAGKTLSVDAAIVEVRGE